MTQTLWVITYAMLPVIGHWTGAALAIGTRPPPWVTGAALHGSAGIAIALISMELMPRIEQSVPVWLMMTLFVLGAAISVAMAASIKAYRSASRLTSGGPLLVLGAIGADLVSDGLMTGAGYAVETYLGLLLAAAQSVANIPGGFAVTASMYQHKMSLKQRLQFAAAMAIPVLASALIGLWLLSGRSQLVQHSALMIIAGVLLLATVEDMIPEGDAPRPARWASSLAFTVGFIGLGLISRYVK